jgi:hypothetical protein
LLAQAIFPITFARAHHTHQEDLYTHYLKAL